MKSFLLLALTFVLMVPIGTISHEYGHIVIAQFYGNTTTLHYASMNYNGESQKFFKWFSEHYDQYLADSNFRNQKVLKQNIGKFTRQSLYISMGGPLQTLACGVLGFLILIVRKRFKNHSNFNGWDWSAVFLALFFSRFFANSIIYFILKLLGKHSSGDEEHIAMYQNWSPVFFELILLLVSGILLTWLVFKLIPFEFRKRFLASAFVGCITGWILWMHGIGPLLLP